MHWSDMAHQVLLIIMPQAVVGQGVLYVLFSHTHQVELASLFSQLIIFLYCNFLRLTDVRNSDQNCIFNIPNICTMVFHSWTCMELKFAQYFILILFHPLFDTLQALMFTTVGNA